VAARWGGELNILVNATGPTDVGSFEQLTDEEWLATIDVGAMGMVRCVRAALPLLRQAEWARIVNVSAHSTKRQSESLVAYTAAKSMVTSITKNLSLALARDEILVNTVSPGSFATESLRSWAQSVGIDADDLYAVMRGINEHFGHPAHLPRAGSAQEIGPVIAFVASRINSYMTGANINVDGGSDFTSPPNQSGRPNQSGVVRPPGPADQSEPVTNGRPIWFTIPGGAAHTAGMALTHGRAVVVAPSKCPSVGSRRTVTLGSPSTSST
jgi:enoyl-[acyl-carrier-protein] reductase (NADH)